MNKTSLDKSKIRVLLLEGIHDSAAEVFARAGYSNLEHLRTSLPEAELLERVKGAHFIGIRSRTQLNGRIFAAAEKLVGVGCFCIGTNQVDLKAATQRGIPVFNAPYSNTRSVAELVLAEVILLLRGVPARNASCHRGGWLKSADSSYESRGKTLGIVGYGNIGTQLGVLAESLGMKVVFYDIATKLPMGNASQTGSLQELLQLADVVTLHVPETEATKRMMGRREFDLMKPKSIFVNASRGSVVDIDALQGALASKKLLGAAVDVFPVEPRSDQEEFVSPLREFDNVILTPHVGGSTQEAQRNIGVEVAEKLVTYSDNGTSLTAVNFPEVALPAHPNAHRILHIHRNVPGVLSELNRVLSGNNITGQYLQTNEEIGYVVIDVAQECSKAALEGVLQVNGTIRARLLF